MNAALTQVSGGLRAAFLANKKLALIILGVIVLFGALLVVTWDSEPAPVGGDPMVRRLTEEQYRTSIADIFGKDIPISGRFEKSLRSDGLISVGTGYSGMSAFAIEQYSASALGIAEAVFDEKRRKRFLTCEFVKPQEFNQECARKFFADKGKLLFRRALTNKEIDKYTNLAASTAQKLGSFYSGMELSLYTMLVSPDFLFRMEKASKGDPSTLDGYSKASRLSFFLTNAPPDAALLKAAQKGELDSRSGVRQQVNRLMASPRLEEAVRVFFADMLHFDKLKDMTKDPAIYPSFNADLAMQAQEQTLRTISEHVIDKEADYRDLFTTRDTHLTRQLGIIYKTPVPNRGEWMPATFSSNSHREGIQSHVSFLALHSHPGRTSPTLRGHAVRQIFMCQDVPDAPASVNFTAVETDAHKPNVTARERIKQHAADPSCAGCHKVMDPLGLTLENYDGVGAFRLRENGALIDSAGWLDGAEFNTTQGLATALRNHPEVPKCLAERLYKSAVGRDLEWEERDYMDWLIDGFESDEYKVTEMMRRIANSKNFFAVKDRKSR